MLVEQTLHLGLVRRVGREGAHPAWLAELGRGAREALQQLRGETELDWTFLSPPALLEPGARSGRYRLGRDQLLMDGEQPARISVADLAVVVLDEIEQRIGLRPMPLTWPVGPAGDFRGVVDLQRGDYHRYSRTDAGAGVAQDDVLDL